MTEENWQFFESKMTTKIKKDWGERFREMMKNNKWSYDDVAKLGKLATINKKQTYHNCERINKIWKTKILQNTMSYSTKYLKQ